MSRRLFTTSTAEAMQPIARAQNQLSAGTTPAMTKLVPAVAGVLSTGVIVSRYMRRTGEC